LTNVSAPLREVALRIRSSLPVDDLVAHRSSETFAGIFVGYTPEQTPDCLNRWQMATNDIN